MSHPALRRALFEIFVRPLLIVKLIMVLIERASRELSNGGHTSSILTILTSFDVNLDANPNLAELCTK